MLSLDELVSVLCCEHAHEARNFFGGLVRNDHDLDVLGGLHLGRLDRALDPSWFFVVYGDDD